MRFEIVQGSFGLGLFHQNDPCIENRPTCLPIPRNRLDYGITQLTFDNTNSQGGQGDY